jgi:hypothetical protein
VFGGGLLGALLLLVAEFTTLFTVQAVTSETPISSVGTGDHHAFAMIPIALFAAALSYGAWRQRSRPALLALGALGVIALVIALAGDLPDAHSSGLIKAGKNLGTGVGSFVNATSRPSTGFYMETLGAAVLMMSCGVGVLLGGAPTAQPQRPIFQRDAESAG